MKFSTSNTFFVLLSLRAPLATAAIAPGRIASLLRPEATSGSHELIEPRRLQDGVAACTFPEDDLIRVPLFDQTQVPFLKPSTFEACMSNVRVSGENMLHHIEHLDKTFWQSYAFHNLARDPAASDPKNHQPELGNTIYEGPYEGQVDLTGRLGDLYDYVKENGEANATTFWDIAEIFGQLNDAHVSLPRLPEGSLAGPYGLYVFPERCLGQGLTTARSEFKYVDGELQMTVIWADSSSGFLFESGESIVSTINGKAPIDYITSLAKSPILYIQYKSLGSRINALFHNGYISLRGHNAYVHFFQATSSPTQVLPDSFLVEYEDGTQETYFVGVYQSNLMDEVGLLEADENGTVVLDRAVMESLVDKPGRMFENFEKALGRIEGPPKEAKFNQTGGMDTVLDVSMEMAETTGGQRREQESFQFDEIFNNVNGEPAGGYVFVKDFAIFKIQDFSVDQPEILSSWVNMTISAKARGIKKVIVDISSNGGGIANSGELMTAAMFPNMEYKWFEDKYDVVYNGPMDLWENDISDTIQDLFVRLDELAEEEMQGIVDSYSDETLAQVQNIADTIKLFCLENCEDLDVPCDDRCDVAERLSKETREFVAERNLDQLAIIIITLYETLASYNPWTAVDSLQYFTEEERKVVRTVNRGGVETNLTKPTTLMTFDQFELVTMSILEIGHNFDHYILLSNGAAGSTTQIFQSAVTQLYRNRDKASGVTSKVTSVSYGGNNNLDDMTLAGFPAVVDTVYNQDPIIAAAGLFMTYTLIPDGTELSDAFADVGSRYFDEVASPAYYSDNYPRISVENYYDSFMNPGALPLEYVKIHPDEHIPQIYYRGISLEDTSDLTELYGEAAKFFSAEGWDAN